MYKRQDIYGALSEYIATCLSQDAVSILDINNTVPMDMYQEQIQGKYPYGYKEVFMGFHCGNAPVCKMAKFNLTSQKVRVKGPAYDYLVSISAGALDGDYAASDITLFRLQSTADGQLRSYVAQGEILPVECHSYGSIGVCAIPEMGRFYRHVLIERNYPHHAAVAFGHFGKEVVDVFRYLGVEEIMFNQPKELPYPSENPFVWAKNRK